MNEYEQAVLRAIAKGPDYVGWYKIEQRLSVLSLPFRGRLPDTLQILADNGLIEPAPDESGRYRITPEGRARLAIVDTDPQGGRDS